MTDKRGRARARRKRRFGYTFERRWPSGRVTWSAQWFEATQGGKRVTRHFDSEKEANDFLDELERQVLAKVYVTPPTVAESMHLDVAPEPPPVPTFVEYAQKLLDGRLAASLAKNTLDVYRANLRALASFYGPRDGRAGARLDEVTAATFLDYRAWRRTTSNHPTGTQTAVSAATCNRDQQFACRVLNEAVVDRHVAANPLAGLRKLKEPRKPRRYLTREEIAAVIEHAPRWFRPLVVAGVYTGARKCELTRLRWSDIDFAGGKIALYRPKVGNADLIDLHPLVAEELTRLRARREKRKTVTDTDHVFLSRRGGPFTNVSRSWEITLERAGLAGREGLTFHSLRHTHATWFLSDGGSISDLQSQLGHAAVSTTQIYAAAVNERRRATVLAMDFRPAGKTEEADEALGLTQAAASPPPWPALSAHVAPVAQDADHVPFRDVATVAGNARARLRRLRPDVKRPHTWSGRSGTSPGPRPSGGRRIRVRSGQAVAQQPSRAVGRQHVVGAAPDSRFTKSPLDEPA